MRERLLVEHAREIFAAALNDCSVERAYERKMRVDHQGGRRLLHVAGETVDMTDVRHLRIVAVGKAAGEMLMGFLSRVPFVPDCSVQGVLIASNRPQSLPAGIEFCAGGHPLPNRASRDGATAALSLVREASTLQDALCLFLISGGGSAMMELPLDPKITLEETATLYQALVHSGAKIAEINCIRKHFSAIKGGRLAQAAAGTPALTIMVSDVPPHELDSLSSGPTVPDPTTIAECRRLLSRYSLDQTLPRSIRRYFASPMLPETPKPGDLKARECVLLDSDDLAAAAGQHASRLCYHVVVDHTCDDWNYQEAAEYLLNRIRTLRTLHERVCLVSAGEVTVSIPGRLEPGVTHLGGRNQHFALQCALMLTPSDLGLAVLSAGSDGIDGNSGSAGGVVGAAMLGMDERLQAGREALRQYDSSTFLSTCGATVTTGPTGNNLRDLRLLLAERR